MHFCRNNPCKKYVAPSENSIHELGTTTAERDLGVIISTDLKASKQVKAAANKANRMLGLLLNTFQFLDLITYKTLYCTFIRPLLEFAVPVWNPFLKKDIDILERVQRRATKRAPGLWQIDYDQRLKILGRATLEERRVRGDLIQQFKIVKGFDKVNWYQQPIFKKDTSSQYLTRGNSLRYMKEIT